MGGNFSGGSFLEEKFSLYQLEHEKHLKDVTDVVLVFLFLILDSFHTLFFPPGIYYIKNTTSQNKILSSI